MAKTIAEEFFELFSGLPRAHGHYALAPTPPKGAKIKREGAAKTVHEPPTVALWARHLKGEYGIGIVPIRDDGTVRFGAIDIDDYELDWTQLLKDIESLQLPLIPTRTKSGGAHCYLFCREDVSAELVRRKLMEWAVLLGHSGVEVFPKQTRLASENDFGNWINMPYFGDQRWAVVDVKKDLLPPRKFLVHARLLSVTAESLHAHAIPDTALPELERFADGPPCLQTLIKREGFPEGSRNNALFNVGVYLKKRYGDDWEQHLDDYNQALMSPPLGHREVGQVAAHLKKKAYEYRCQEPPINACCNRQICLTRKYGIGTGGTDEPGVVFGQLVKLDVEPPIWIWDVDGARIELMTAEIKDQQRFHIRCIETLNKWPNVIRPKTWAELVRKRLETVTVIPAPPDAKPKGHILSLLEQYCVGRSPGRAKEELLLGKPWTDPEAKRTYFRSTDFLKYLQQQRVYLKPSELYGLLRSGGAQHHFLNLKGKGANYWSVPAFASQEEPFEVPDLPPEEM